MFEHITQAAMESILEDEALYRGLTDHEATILVQWAEGRIGIVLFGASDDETARQRVAREVKRLRAAFKAIARQAVNFMPCERSVVIAAATAILSELWNVGDGDA